MSDINSRTNVHGDNNVVGNNVRGGTGGQAPPNPFTAAGRAHGQSNKDLRDRGLDGLGHPLPSQNDHPSQGEKTGKSQLRGARGQSIAQLAQSIGSMELSNQDDLHEFCEAYRAILNYLAVTAKMADGQLRAAARANARQAKDGWLSPGQAVKLAATLKMVGRDLDHLANACVSGAADAVKAWRRFEGVLDDIESSNGRGVSRPGGRRGGFSVV